MANIKFFYDNKWDNISDITPRTEQTYFPAENTQHRDFNFPWESRHGAGTGWGWFSITSSTNKLYFNDNGGTPRTATLTVATYSASTLCTQIKTQMEAVTSDTFTVTYNESGTDTCKFNIKDDVGTFQLTVTLTTDAIWDVIGYDVENNKTGADNYTSDYVRIHTSEELVGDLGSAESINAFLVKYHNIQSGATTNLIQGNTSDSWSSPAFSIAVTYGADIMGRIFSSSQSYQWWRHSVIDEDNPDYYIYEGRIFLGPSFEPTTNFINQPHGREKRDPSIINTSEGGQESSIQLTHYDVWTYIFRVKGSTQIGYFNTMFDTVGTSKPLFIAEDPDNFPSDCYYCRLTDWSWAAINQSIDYWELSITVKELV